jgi:hypothetical protein
MWKPVIAAVNGTVAAGAFYLLGQVDFIISADHATFVEPHVTYAMPAVYEPIEALAKMPFGEAMRMALLGTYERMSAQRAHEIGFVTEIVPLEELMDVATWAAEAIASQPPAAIMSTLRTLWAARDMFPSQATALGNTFLHLGMDADKENLKEGEEATATRARRRSQECPPRCMKWSAKAFIQTCRCTRRSSCTQPSAPAARTFTTWKPVSASSKRGGLAAADATYPGARTAANRVPARTRGRSRHHDQRRRRY